MDDRNPHPQCSSRPEPDHGGLEGTGTVRPVTLSALLRNWQRQDGEPPAADMGVDPVEALLHEIAAGVGADGGVPLATGGMGVVHNAPDVALRRRVARKVLRNELRRSPANVARFVAEAQIAGQLEHPGIVPVHQLGVDADGNVFYTMKLVGGRTLAAALKDRPATSAATREVFLDKQIDTFLRLCDAVAFAHSRGVIHRDLKPDNVMVGEFGEVLLLDWGLAKLVDGSAMSEMAGGTATSAIPDGAAGPFATLEGTVMGTPAYMPPEMANADHARTGKASDVYLLGAILYEILSGHPPHAGCSRSEMLQAAKANRLRPCDETGDLMHIARKAMSTDPAERHGSVIELQEDIRAYRRHEESIALTERSRAHLADADASGSYDAFARALFGFRDALDLWPGNHAAEVELGRGTLAYARSALGKADLDLAESLLGEANPEHAECLLEVRRARRDRDSRLRRLRMVTRAATTLTVITVTVLTLAVLWIQASRRRAVRAEARAVIDKNRSELARQQTRTQKEMLEVEHYINSIALADQALHAGDFTNARRLLEGCAPRLRGWEWGWLAKRCLIPLAEFAGHIERCGWAEFSPDGRLAAASTGENAAHCWDVRSGQQVWTRENSSTGPIHFPTGPRFSPDGHWIAIPYRGDRVHLYTTDAHMGEPVRTLKIQGSAGPLAFCADGSRLLGVAEREATVWSLPEGNVIWAVARYHTASAADISPDGRQVAIPPTDGKSPCSLVHLDSGAIVTFGTPSPACAMAFVGDGTLAVGLENGTLQVRDPATGDLRREIAIDAAAITRMRCTRDRRRLLVGTLSGLVHVCLTEDWRTEFRLQAHDAPITGLDMHPGGRLLLTAAKELRLWPFPPPDSMHAVPYSRMRGDLLAQAWHPDGRRMVLTNGANLFVYDHATDTVTMPDALDRDLTAWRQRTGIGWCWFSQFSFSPDGRFLAFTGGADQSWLFVVDASTWEILATHPVYVHDFEAVTVNRLFLSDSDHILVVPRDPENPDAVGTTGRKWERTVLPTVLNWRTGERVVVQTRGLLRPLLAPDATILGALLPGGVIELRDLTSEGTVRQRFHRSLAYSTFAAFSPAGETLFAATFQNVTAWNTREGGIRHTLDGHRDMVIGIAPSPDGRRVATTSEDGTCRIWDAATGRPLLVIPLSRGFPGSAAWSPDGSRLSLGGRRRSPAPLYVCQSLPVETTVQPDFTRVRACVDAAP